MHNDKRKLGLVVAYQYFFLGESHSQGNEKKGFSEKHHTAEQLKLYLFHHTTIIIITEYEKKCFCFFFFCEHAQY